MGKRLAPELATARRVRCRQALTEQIDNRDEILAEARKRDVSEENRTKAHEGIQAMVDACTSGGSQNTHASIVNRYIAYCKTNTLPPFPMVPGVVALFFHDEMGNLANWDPSLSILNKMRKHIQDVFSEEYPEILVEYKDTASPLQPLYGMSRADKPKKAKGKGKGKAVEESEAEEEAAVAQELKAVVPPQSIDDLLTHRAHYMDAIKTIKTPDEDDVKAIKVCEVYIKTLESDKGRKAHHNYLKRFRTWCKDKETPVFPIHPAALALFLADRCMKFDWHTISLMFEHFRKETLPLFTNEHPWVTTGLREDVTLAAFLAAPRKQPLAVRRRPGKPSAKDLLVDDDNQAKEAEASTPAPATPDPSSRPDKSRPAADELPIVFTSIPHLLTRTYVSDLVAVFGRDEIKPQDGRKNIVSKCAQRLENDPAVRTQLEKVVNDRLLAARAKLLADRPPEVYDSTPAPAPPPVASTSTVGASEGTPDYLDPMLLGGAGQKRAREDGDEDVEVPEKRQKA